MWNFTLYFSAPPSVPYSPLAYDGLHMWFTLHIVVGKLKYKLHQTHLTIVKADRQVLNNIRYITCSILSVLHTFKVCIRKQNLCL